MLRGLDQRHNDGLKVTLLWDDLDDTVHVDWVDERNQLSGIFQVDKDQAKLAFEHPFAIAQLINT